MVCEHYPAHTVWLIDGRRVADSVDRTIKQVIPHLLGYDLSRDVFDRRGSVADRFEYLSGLPPAFIIVGELDLFVDEDIEYAQRLNQAGVPTELHVFPGAFHGSDLMVPTSDNSQRWAAIRTAALRQALAEAPLVS